MFLSPRLFFFNVRFLFRLPLSQKTGHPAFPDNATRDYIAENDFGNIGALKVSVRFIIIEVERNK